LAVGRLLGGRAAFIALVRANEAEVTDLYAKLGPIAKPADDDGLEKIRVAMCAPGYVAPDDDKLGVNLALTIRGTAQQDPVTGKRWLDNGILTTYERTDNADGTFIVNIKWSDDVLNRLVASQSKIYRAVASEHDRYCKGLTA
jgi:hypothetical protein